MVKNVQTCDLCGQKIDGEPVHREFDGEEKKFCCQGCAQVYEAAYNNDMLDQVVQKPVKKSSIRPELVLDRGQTEHFSVNGMWCAGCAVAAEKVLKNQPGVNSVDISFAAEQGRISYDPEKVDIKSIERFG